MSKAFKYKLLADTREKENLHILKNFEKNNIPYERIALRTGDYMIECDGFIPKIMIERKASIDELLQNLIDRNSLDEESKVNRFHRELIRAEAQDIRVIILIENVNWYSDVLKHNYKSKIKPTAARGLIMSLENKYSNVIIKEIEKEKAASYIHSTLYYALREQLKMKEV